MIADALTIWITKDVHKILLPSGSWKLLLIFYAAVCYFRMFKAFTYIAFSHLAIWKTRIVQIEWLAKNWCFLQWFIWCQFCSFAVMILMILTFMWKLFWEINEWLSQHQLFLIILFKKNRNSRIIGCCKISFYYSVHI